LEQAITSIQRKRKIKRGEPVNETDGSSSYTDQRVEINLNIPARFPDAYLPDVHLRLTMYKRIASARSREQLEELEIETIDRFGLLPDAAKHLFRIAELKLKAAQCDIKSIEVGPAGGSVKFLEDPQINIDNMMRTIATSPAEYRFAGTESIQISREMPEPADRFEMVIDVLEMVKM